jgi:multidrug efflux pump subunit AcrA (membrane-fusion protein)
MISKRYWAIGLLVLLAITLAGCGRAPTPQPTPTPVATAPLAAGGPRSSGGNVVASGEVVPALKADMSFTVAGRVQTVAVTEGDEIQAGEVLATLETAGVEAQIAQAEAALAVSQANLAQIQAEARPEEIAAAQEALTATQAGVSAARANVASAQAALAKLKAGPKSEELTMAKAAMEKAAVALQLAQSEYDKIAWHDGIGATQQAVALQQASIDYESTKASYEALVRGATAEELDMAKAAVEAARAQVDVAQAQAGQAKAQLDQLLAGPSAEAINVSEAQVQQAQAALEAAQVALDQTMLRAPFAGTVAVLEVSAGETVLPGQTVLTLADLSHLQVETTDLSERDVDEVAVGQQAIVYVEALGSEIAGRVVRIANQASKIGGDVVYTVVVELDEQPLDLRWGMSVDVTITTR